MVLAVVTFFCYCLIRHTKAKIQLKDAIRVVLGIIGVGILVYALINNNSNYIFGFITAQFIFKSFNTDEDDD